MWNCWIKVFELDAGVGRSEASVDGGLGVVASKHVGGELTFERCHVRDASVRANRMHRGELNFSHVKPTSMLGRVVKLQPFAQTVRFGRLEGLVERRRAMRVQVVEHQANEFGLGVDHIKQPFNPPREIVHRTPLGYYQFTPATLGFAEPENGASAVTFVLAVIARRSARLHGYGNTDFFDQLLGRLVHAHHRAAPVIRGFVYIEYVFHVRDKLRAYLRDTPLLLLPGLEVVFFRIWRTVSWQIDSANPNSTTLPASRRRVQRARPSGGCVQGTAIKCASCLPLNLRCCPGRGLSFNAASSPSSTKRWRTRPPVADPTSKATATCSSLSPSLALSKIRARAARRADTLPREMNLRNCCSSSSLRSTKYLTLAIIRPPPSCEDRTLTSPHMYHINID